MATQAVTRGTPITPSRLISIYLPKYYCSESCKQTALGQDSSLLDMKPEQEVFDV